MVVDGGRNVVFLVFIISVVLASALPAHALSASTDRDKEVVSPVTNNPRDRTITSGLSQIAPNNSSVRHERRDRLDESGDLTALQQWFTSSLGSQLERSVVTLEQGEYERAQSLVGDSYQEKLGRFVDVAGETGDDGESSPANAFEAAQESQQEYVKDVQEYRKTYREYQDAKQAGNDSRARELARELNQFDSQIQETGETLSASYANISENHQIDLAQANRSVTNTTETIATQQTTVRRDTFTNTTLTITDRTATASFQTPVRITGHLTAANGTRLDDRQIVLSLSNRTVQTRTTANGTFTVSIRPTLEALGRHPVSLQYVPRSTAIYLGANTTVPVNISQVTPTVTLTQTPQSATFNQTVTIRGQVHASNVSAPNVPVRVAIRDTVLGTTRTTPNGTFTLHTRLPATAPAGTQTVHVSLPVEDQALARANATSEIQITSTATELTLFQRSNASAQAPITLNGTLTTEGGALLANESIELRVDNQTVAIVSTNSTGAYQEQITPDTLENAQQTNNSTVVVTAVYPGPGNLEVSRAQTVVAVSEPTSAGNELLWLGLGGFVLLSILGGIGLYRYRGSPEADTEPTAPTASTDANTLSDGEQPTTDATAPVGQTLHDHAVSQLDAGHTDTAVQAAYSAVRQQTIDVLGWDSQEAASRTYWEFYHACTADNAMTDPQRTALKQLTEYYEQAQFTSTAMATDHANEAITTAAEFLDEFDSTHTDVAD